MLQRFDHLTLAVHALAAAQSAYEVLLGRPPTWHGKHANLGTETALFGLENALIELTAPRADSLEAEGLRTFLAERGAGPSALAFGTDDAASCHTQLRERGLRVTPPEHDEAHGADGVSRHYAAMEVSPRMTRSLPILVVERSDSERLRDASNIPASCPHALDHVVVRSADLASARVLYGEQLGLRLALDTVIGGVGMLFFRLGGVTLEVVEDAAAGAQDAFFGAAFRVRDLAAAHARLLAAGLTPSAIRAGKKPGTHVCSLRADTLEMPMLILEDPSRS